MSEFNNSFIVFIDTKRDISVGVVIRVGVGESRSPSSVTDRDKKFSSAFKRPDRPLCQTSLLFSVCRGQLPQVSGSRVVNLTTRCHLIPRLKLSGAPWVCYGHIHVLYYFTAE